MAFDQIYVSTNIEENFAESTYFSLPTPPITLYIPSSSWCTRKPDVSDLQCGALEQADRRGCLADIMVVPPSVAAPRAIVFLPLRFHNDAGFPLVITACPPQNEVEAPIFPAGETCGGLLRRRQKLFVLLSFLINLIFLAHFPKQSI
jgi:hypothetical protein